MARGRKKNEPIKLVITPKEKEATDLEIPLGMEATQNKRALEQQPPLPSIRMTSKINGTVITTMELSKTVKQGQEEQHNEDKVLASKNVQKNLEWSEEPEKKWVNFSETNRLSTKEIGLISYVALIMMNGKKVVELLKMMR